MEKSVVESTLVPVSDVNQLLNNPHQDISSIPATLVVKSDGSVSISSAAIDTQSSPIQLAMIPDAEGQSNLYVIPKDAGKSQTAFLVKPINGQGWNADKTSFETAGHFSPTMDKNSLMIYTSLTNNLTHKTSETCGKIPEFAELSNVAVAEDIQKTVAKVHLSPQNIVATPVTKTRDSEPPLVASIHNLKSEGCPKKKGSMASVLPETVRPPVTRVATHRLCEPAGMAIQSSTQLPGLCSGGLQDRQFSQNLKTCATSPLQSLIQSQIQSGQKSQSVQLPFTGLNLSIKIQSSRPCTSTGSQVIQPVFRVLTPVQYASIFSALRQTKQLATGTTKLGQNAEVTSKQNETRNVNFANSQSTYLNTTRNEQQIVNIANLQNNDITSTQNENHILNSEKTDYTTTKEENHVLNISKEKNSGIYTLPNENQNKPITNVEVATSACVKQPILFLGSHKSPNIVSVQLTQASQMPHENSLVNVSNSQNIDLNSTMIRSQVFTVPNHINGGLTQIGSQFLNIANEQNTYFSRQYVEQHETRTPVGSSATTQQPNLFLGSQEFPNVISLACTVASQTLSVIQANGVQKQYKITFLNPQASSGGTVMINTVKDSHTTSMCGKLPDLKTSSVTKYGISAQEVEKQQSGVVPDKLHTASSSMRSVKASVLDNVYVVDGKLYRLNIGKEDGIGSITPFPLANETANSGYHESAPLTVASNAATSTVISTGTPVMSSKVFSFPNPKDTLVNQGKTNVLGMVNSLPNSGDMTVSKTNTMQKSMQLTSLNLSQSVMVQNANSDVEYPEISANASVLEEAASYVSGAPESSSDKTDVSLTNETNETVGNSSDEDDVMILSSTDPSRSDRITRFQDGLEEDDEVRPMFLFRSDIARKLKPAIPDESSASSTLSCSGSLNVESATTNCNATTSIAKPLVYRIGTQIMPTTTGEMLKRLDNCSAKTFSRLNQLELVEERQINNNNMSLVASANNWAVDNEYLMAEKLQIENDPPVISYINGVKVISYDIGTCSTKINNNAQDDTNTIDRVIVSEGNKATVGSDIHSNLDDSERNGGFSNEMNERLPIKIQSVFSLHPSVNLNLTDTKSQNKTENYTQSSDTPISDVAEIQSQEQGKPSQSKEAHDGLIMLDSVVGINGRTMNTKETESALTIAPEREICVAHIQANRNCVYCRGRCRVVLRCLNMNRFKAPYSYKAIQQELLGNTCSKTCREMSTHTYYKTGGAVSLTTLPSFSRQRYIPYVKVFPKSKRCWSVKKPKRKSYQAKESSGNIAKTHETNLSGVDLIGVSSNKEYAGIPKTSTSSTSVPAITKSAKLINCPVLQSRLNMAVSTAAANERCLNVYSTKSQPSLDSRTSALTVKKTPPSSTEIVNSSNSQVAVSPTQNKSNANKDNVKSTETPTVSINAQIKSELIGPESVEDKIDLTVHGSLEVSSKLVTLNNTKEEPVTPDNAEISLKSVTPENSREVTMNVSAVKSEPLNLGYSDEVSSSHHYLPMTKKRKTTDDHSGSRELEYVNISSTDKEDKDETNRFQIFETIHSEKIRRLKEKLKKNSEALDEIRKQRLPFQSDIGELGS